MKFTLVIARLLLASMIGCGPSAQEKKANSPECLAAKREAAERQAKTELLNTEIAAGNEDQAKGT